MYFLLPFENLTDSELFAFTKEHDVPPFLQYSHLVFQPLVSSNGQDGFFNPDSQNDTYNGNFTCHYFDLHNEDPTKTSTSTAYSSCLTLAFLTIKCV